MALFDLGFGYGVFLLAASFIIGTLFASFVSCWAYRFCAGESIVKGRSKCDSCEHELSPLDLVPIISWIALRGKCRYCGEKIPASCIVCEAVLGAVFAAIVFVYGISIETLELMGFSCVLLFVSLTDMIKRIIPNKALVVAVLIRAAYLAYAGFSGTIEWMDALYFLLSGVIVGILVLVVVLVGDFILKAESMGGGDIKLFAVAAFYFGASQMLLLIIFACILGIIIAKASGRGKKDPFPFGPSIAISCVFTMLLGSALVNLYVGLF